MLPALVGQKNLSQAFAVEMFSKTLFFLSSEALGLFVPTKMQQSFQFMKTYYMMPLICIIRAKYLIIRNCTFQKNSEHENQHDIADFLKAELVAKV